MCLAGRVHTGQGAGGRRKWLKGACWLTLSRLSSPTQSLAAQVLLDHVAAPRPPCELAMHGISPKTSYLLKTKTISLISHLGY